MRAPHGLHGEVRVEPLTDLFAERFRAGSTLLCEGVGELTLEAVRGTEGAPIVRFAGYDDRDAAEKLRNKELAVPREEARRAAGDAYLWSDLIGLEATTPDGHRLGVVREIIRAGETDVLVVADGTAEVLLPMLGSVIRSVDLASGRIVAVPQEELG